MQEFVMLVGIPGSGKSTYASKSSYTVFSSDAIRLELFGDENVQDQNYKVFDTLHKRLLRALKAGHSCIYDATNLSSSKRIGTLDLIESLSKDIKKTCIIFATPIEVCIERDSKRSKFVGEDVINRMVKNFQCPMLFEGWDDIQILYTESAYTIPDLASFDQNTEHHRLTLQEHMIEAAKYIMNYSTDPVMEFTTRWHDIGKYYTKTFYNLKGEKTADAHYYGHDSYGAYLMLTHFDAFANASDLDDSLRTNDIVLRSSALIAYHMHPYLSWKVSERARKRDESRMGDLYPDIMKIHMADAYAH